MYIIVNTEQNNVFCLPDGSAPFTFTDPVEAEEFAERMGLTGYEVIYDEDIMPN